MSETPQEILDRAAPIWDKHVVSFTLVLAALRATLAERDALRAEVARERRERISAESGCETQAAARYAAEVALKATQDMLREEEEQRRLARIAAEAERDALRTHVEAVLALHQPGALGNACRHCLCEWPCPTRRALEGEK